jgi:hypothetical protein
MKTITVRLENDRDAELLKSILKETKFESSIETFIEEDDLSSEELHMLEERIEEYRRDPTKATGITEVRELLKKKYGI